jgi:hypothetical protein
VWTDTSWVASTAYVVGDIRKPTNANETGLYYYCSVAGTSSGSEPTWPTTVGNTVTDNTVTWQAVEGWQELTEGIDTGVDAVTSNTVFTLDNDADVSDLDDYYNGWFIIVYDSGGTLRGRSYVTDYTGSTRQITLKYAVTASGGVVATDTVVLARFPIFQNNATLTPAYQVDDLPTFTQVGNDLYIYTGLHNPDTEGFDLWLGYINQSGYYDDTDLAFNGFHCDMLTPVSVHTPGDWISSTAGTGSASDPIPYSDPENAWFISEPALLLDGFQETNVYTPIDVGYTQADNMSGADEYQTITLATDVMQNFDRRTDYYSTQDPNFSHFNRRVTHYLQYAALGQTSDTAAGAHPRTPFYLIKTIDINDSGWSLTSGSTYGYTAFDLYGSDWLEAQPRDTEQQQGHRIRKVGGTARQAVTVAGHFIMGPVFVDDKKLRDTLVVAPRTGPVAGSVVTPAALVKDHINIRARDAGIDDVVAITEHLGRLIVFGKNRMAIAVLDGPNSRFDEQFQQRGLVSDRAYTVIDNILYFASKESIYAFDGRVVRDVGLRIRKDWQTIAQSDKEAAIMGYNRRNKTLLLKAGLGIYLFDTIKNEWSTESADKTWLSFLQDANDKLVGLDSTGLWELDADSFTVSRAFTWKTNPINSKRIRIRRFQCGFKSSDDLTVKFFDESVSTSVPRTELTLSSQSTEDTIDIPISFDATRLVVEVTTSTSTNSDLEIDNFRLRGHVLDKR